MSLNRQPKPETLKRVYQNTLFTGEELAELAEWVRRHLQLEHVSAHNTVLKALIAYKQEERCKANSIIQTRI